MPKNGYWKIKSKAQKKRICPFATYGASNLLDGTQITFCRLLWPQSMAAWGPRGLGPQGFLWRLGGLGASPPRGLRAAALKGWMGCGDHFVLTHSTLDASRKRRGSSDSTLDA